MVRLLIIFQIFTYLSHGQILQTPYEKGNGNQTATWEETIDFYQMLDEKFEKAKLIEYGLTDIGKPLHLFVIDQDKNFSPEIIETQDKVVFMINNGIHPGEPEGIDASMALARDLLTNSTYDSLLSNVVIIIVPIYNVGGALNRNSTSRTNQSGPEEYGFRGNAKNLDLNRDFIKLDSRNAQTFTQIFRTWKPHFFIDTHTSNGADYQYVMTLIATQKDKLQPNLAQYMNASILPSLYKKMEEESYPMIPYVNTIEAIPDSGIKAYLETPRYSTGYAALYNCIGLVSETHMLKPFPERMKATYALLLNALELLHQEALPLKYEKAKADEVIKNQQKFDLNWELDQTKFNMIDFKGYEAFYEKSKLTKQDQLFYNDNKPYDKKIRFYDSYQPTASVLKPEYYIVPQAYQSVINLLQLNDVKMSVIQNDTALAVEVSYIENYSTYPNPYEGHYLHYNTTILKDTQELKFYRGDYIIYTDQFANRYIIETLEPEGVDSYFNWGFFDNILQEREGFSDYVFHKEAEEMIEKDPDLKKDFYKYRAQNKELKGNELLEFIYKRSPHYYTKSMRYPVVRSIQ